MIVKYIKDLSHADAIGLRLYDQGDYPFIAHLGFTDSFLIRENSLLETDLQGNPQENAITGLSNLECLCGAMIRKNIDFNQPCFTKNGSFHSNNVPATEMKFKNNTCIRNIRKTCYFEGNKSMTIIPIVFNGVTLGLLNLYSKKFNHFTGDLVEFLEFLMDIVARKIALTSSFTIPTIPIYKIIIVSICSVCKKVHHNKKWVNFDEYFSTLEHIKKIKFSHGLCPDCMHNFYNIDNEEVENL